MLLLCIDDVIVQLTDFDSYVKILEEVLQQFYSAGRKLNSSKCELLYKYVKYLGHVVSAKIIATDPDKVAEVRE